MRLLKIDRNVSIKSVFLSKNSIHQVPDLTEIPDLQNLDLSDNFINSTSDFLSDFANLVNLDLSLNRIQSVDSPISIVTLKRLNLSHCEIVGLKELGRLPNLITLDLSHNKIRILDSSPFEYADKLTFLDVSRNELVQIDFSGLASLSILNVGFNRIDDAVFSVNLKELRAEENKMETMPRNHVSLS